MIRFLEDANRCSITIDQKYNREDIELLEKLFAKEYEYYELFLVFLYTIEVELVLFLKKQQSSKNLIIYANRSRLIRYLHKLSIDAVLMTDSNRLSVGAVNTEIILIGGSANSSSKIIALLNTIDIKKFSVIIVQHIGDKISITLEKLMQKYSHLRVTYAQDGEYVEKNHIYIAPRDKHLKIEGSVFVLDDGQSVNEAKPSVSVSFASFSEFYKEKLLVILECGYANDGVDVLAELKRNGTSIIIQDPKECSHASSMPKYAIEKQVYDYVFTLKEMQSFFLLLNNNYSEEEWIEYFLEEIYKKYEYDYREYDKNMLLRRIKIFMTQHELKSIHEFVILMLTNSFAFKLFFLTISINVSEFFRDPLCMQKILAILKKFRHNYNIKIWSAGVSCGQEAYSIAILLDLVNILDKSLIYATDFNPVVLDEAKNGLYGLKEYRVAQKNFQKITKSALLEDYLIKHDSFIEMKASLKEKILFFVHNLQNSSSFNEFDFIVCRNVLIYFNADLQERVFKLLYDSLKFGGYLFLGSNEFLLASYEKKFELYDEKCKIFKKVR